MLFTLDIGNTNIKTALFDGAEMVHYWRLSTTRKYTSDELGVMITQLFDHEKIERGQVDHDQFHRGAHVPGLFRHRPHDGRAGGENGHRH